jgi:hypothetical protein
MDLINQNLIIVLYGYSEQLISLDQLKHWLAGNVWELAESPSPLDRMLLGELELAISEYDRGDRDAAYLRQQAWFLLHLPNPELSPQLKQLLSISPAV